MEQQNIHLLRGTVVSKLPKTAVVDVRRFTRHPRYGKFLARDKRFLAHDSGDKVKVGEVVTIKPSRPISRRKHFVIV